jgi:hypothetical protein
LLWISGSESMYFHSRSCSCGTAMLGISKSTVTETTPSFEVVKLMSSPLKVILLREEGAPPKISTGVVALTSPVRAKAVPSTAAVRTR